MRLEMPNSFNFLIAIVGQALAFRMQPACITVPNRIGLQSQLSRSKATVFGSRSVISLGHIAHIAHLVRVIASHPFWLLSFCSVFS